MIKLANYNDFVIIFKLNCNSIFKNILSIYMSSIIPINIKKCIGGKNMFIEIEDNRIKDPEDRLIKMMIVYFGERLHKYLKIPGEFKNNCSNEYPGPDGEKRIDVCYIICLNEKDQLVDLEDESSRVNKETLKKIIHYSRNIECGKNIPVVSVITTTVPLDKCLKEMKISETKILKPIIISFPEFDGEEKLENLRNKINRGEIVDEMEALDLLFITKMFKKDNEIILEEVCELLSKLKVEDPEFKENMKTCMQCVIHKYAKTIEDIKRLEKVINLTRTFKTFEETLKSIGKEEGEKIGIEKGEKIGIEKEKKKNEREKEEMAKKLLEMGDSVEKVGKVTNLSQEKLIAIQSTIIF